MCGLFLLRANSRAREGSGGSRLLLLLKGALTCALATLELALVVDVIVEEVLEELVLPELLVDALELAAMVAYQLQTRTFNAHVTTRKDE